MTYDDLCMYCFHELDADGNCPNCGKDNNAAVPQIQLLPGTLLHGGRFLIGRAIGQDARGIVYTALDTMRDSTLRVREYLPRDAAERRNDGGVVPLAGCEDEFDNGMRRLRASVENVEDPTKRHLYFEENGTCYIAQKQARRADPEPDEPDDPEEEDYGYSGGGLSGRKLYIIIGAAVAAVVVIAVVIILLLSNASDQKDETMLELPVLTDAVWTYTATPSPTPYVAPTFQTITSLDLAWQEDDSVSGQLEDFKSTQIDTKTAAPTEEPFTLTTAMIKTVQQNLKSVGLLTNGSVDGSYGKKSKAAMKTFQEWVNGQLGYAALRTDGVCDEASYNYLAFSVQNGFSVIDEEPTVKPGGTVESVSIYIDGKLSTGKTRYLSNDETQFSWSATGSVACYTVEITDGFDNVLASKDHTTRTSFTIDTEAIAPNTVYTITVTAYASNDSDDGSKTATAQFAQMSLSTPTAVQTEEPDEVIDASSSAEDVKEVQQMLKDIGLLDSKVDGKYGKATKSAVLVFQEWFNDNYVWQGFAELPETGTVDLMTLKRLTQVSDAGYDVGQAIERASVTEEPFVTEEPVATEEPIVTEEPAEEDDTIGPGSPKASVRHVQNMLITIGFMNEGSADGAYGKATTAAVLSFQEWFNERYADEYGAIDENGLCDGVTTQWLETCANEWGINIREEEEEPEQQTKTVDRSSSTADIAYMQDMLVQTGAMDGRDADGTWNDETDIALNVFRRWYNEEGFGVTLDEDDYACDETTFKCLDQCASDGMSMDDATAARLRQEIAPTAAPTEEPEKGINAQSSRDEIYDLQDRLLQVHALEEQYVTGEWNDETEDAIVTFVEWFNDTYGKQKGTLEYDGYVDELTDQYLTKCIQNDMLMPTATPEPTEEPTPEPTRATEITRESGKDDIRYAQGLLCDVGLLDDGGVDGAWGKGTSAALARFKSWFNSNYGAKYGYLDESDVFDEQTLTRLEECIEKGFTVPLTEATEEPTPEPTPEPTRATEITRESSKDDIRYAQGLLRDVGLLDDDGVDGAWGKGTSAALARFKTWFNNNYGTRYGVIDENDVFDEETLTWLEACIEKGITVPLTDPTEEPEAEPTEEPEPEVTEAPEVHYVSEPTLTIEGDTREEDGIVLISGESVTFTWTADGDVAYYHVYLEDIKGNTKELGDVVQESMTANVASFTVDVKYRLVVYAVPVNGGLEDATNSILVFMRASEETDEPDEPVVTPTMPPVIDRETDPEYIALLQQRLNEFGWIGDDDIEFITLGELDDITLQAIQALQIRINETYGEGTVEVLDPENTAPEDIVIDEVTLALLMDEAFELMP